MVADRDEGRGAVTPFLAICPWDIERWQSSRAYRRMSLAAQGAYLNLCLSAWKTQPTCVLRDDDRELWRLANARSLEEWRVVKAEVFDSDAWSWSHDGWLNEVVFEMFQESNQKYAAAVRSGRIAGKASARVRRALAQTKRNKEDGTAVERSLNDRQPGDRSTAVHRTSPSPSPSKNPPNPPSAEGGPNGLRLTGQPLELAVADLIAYWRLLGRFTKDGWVKQTTTIPSDKRIRRWKRDLRSGRRQPHEIRSAIEAAVWDEHLQAGRLVGSERWPPIEEAQPPPMRGN